MHVVPTGEASPNVTVVDEAEQLGTKYGDFLHDLTLFALVSVEASADQRQHAKSMVEATTHIFHSRSKAMSTSVGVLKAKSELSGPRVDLLHQNSISM